VSDQATCEWTCAGWGYGSFVMSYDLKQCFCVRGITISQCQSNPSYNTWVIATTPTPTPTPPSPDSTWWQYTGYNCYRGAGASQSWPAVSSSSSGDCQSQCQAKGADAFVMEQGAASGTCWCASGVSLGSCQHPAPYSTWIQPYSLGQVGHAQLAQPAHRAHRTGCSYYACTEYYQTNCFVGQGATSSTERNCSRSTDGVKRPMQDCGANNSKRYP